MQSVRSLEDTAVSDNGSLGGGATAGTDLLKSVDDILTLDDLTKDDMSAIQPRCLLEGDEELGAVCVGTSVGHGEKVGAGVLEVEVLVLEFHAIDRFSTGAVAVGEVATLSHELWDNSVEVAAHVVKEFASVVLIEAFS